MDFSLQLKIDLAAHCRGIIQQRINTAQEAMNAAQAAANSEEKSTAGDKYDTARAMNQRDRDMNARQLSDCLSMLHLFNSIPIDRFSNAVHAGSLVKTSTGIYFITVGLGKVILHQSEYAVISAISPMANILIGKTVGDIVLFQERQIEILIIV